jgi:hypothetical protein
MQSAVSTYQENIDFKTLIGYRKASTKKEEACQWDSAEALSKENPARHSLSSQRSVTSNSRPVNSYLTNAEHFDP